VRLGLFGGSFDPPHLGHVELARRAKEELDLERLGRREGERAEDAEAAGLAHRRHDVATVAEGEDRELDAEGVAEAGAH